MTKNTRSIKKIPLLPTSFTLILSMTSANLMASTPEYVEAVKLDISEFETKIFQEQPNSPWLPSSQKARVDGSDSLESFSQFLSKRFPGSYILFSKLDKPYQEKIWKNYVNTGDLGGIRSDIYTFRRKSVLNR